MKYIALDAGKLEIGIKDCNSEYPIDLDSLGLSSYLLKEIEVWYNSYQNLNYISDNEKKEVEAKKLDEIAINLSNDIKRENYQIKIDYYFSDYFGKRIWIR